MSTNRWKQSLAVLTMLVAGGLMTAKVDAQQKYSKEQIKKATETAILVVNGCKDGDFKKVVGTFDATMTRVMPEGKLKQTWSIVQSQAGKYESYGKTRTDQVQIYLRVFVPCKFKKAPLDLVVVFDPKLKVAGLSFKPAVKTDADGKVRYHLPSYADPKSYTEKEVEFGVAGWKLPGTLTIPKKGSKFPAVVLVHGSGPNNRDEEIGPNKVFKDIAVGLASRGIAVLRYEKRTLHYKKKIVKKKDFTLNEETVDDALEAVNFLQNEDRIDPKRIIVLGHSLGGYAIPRMADRDKGKKIAGFVIMAGCTRPVHLLIKEQTKYLLGLDGEVSESDQKKIDETNAAAEKISSKKELEAMSDNEAVMGAWKYYWLDLHDYRPAELAKTSVKVPALILQGGRDYQVRAEIDFAQWKEALGDNKLFKFKKFRSLNHLMIAGKGQPNPQEYQQPGNVSKSVIRSIADWVESEVK